MSQTSGQWKGYNVIQCIYSFLNYLYETTIKKKKKKNLIKNKQSK